MLQKRKTQVFSLPYTFPGILAITSGSMTTACLRDDTVSDGCSGYCYSHLPQPPHTDYWAANDSVEKLERVAPHLFRMMHHRLHFTWRHYPVNYCASGTAAQASQMSVPCTWKEQFEAIISELYQAMLFLLESQSHERDGVLPFWYHTVVLFNVYLWIQCTLIIKKELLNGDNWHLFTYITYLYFIKNWRFLLLSLYGTYFYKLLQGTQQLLYVVLIRTGIS